jgi:hypothetical protein
MRSAKGLQVDPFALRFFVVGFRGFVSPDVTDFCYQFLHYLYP